MRVELAQLPNGQIRDLFNSHGRIVKLAGGAHRLNRRLAPFDVAPVAAHHAAYIPRRVGANRAIPSHGQPATAQRDSLVFPPSSRLISLLASSRSRVSAWICRRLTSRSVSGPRRAISRSARACASLSLSVVIVVPASLIPTQAASTHEKGDDEDAADNPGDTDKGEQRMAHHAT